MSSSRRHQILEVLARELENKPGSRITTAGLAAAVGVSEAALYRHFASKAKMFDGLLEFAEQSIFGLFNQVMEQQRDARTRCFHLTSALLQFAERNPGITRVLVGDVLLGEHERLRSRVAQLHARIETQFRQALREEALDGAAPRDPQAVSAVAELLLAVVTGRLHRYVRSDFAVDPASGWDVQWSLLCEGVFGR